MLCDEMKCSVMYCGQSLHWSSSALNSVTQCQIHYSTIHSGPWSIGHLVQCNGNQVPLETVLYSNGLMVISAPLLDYFEFHSIEVCAAT